MLVSSLTYLYESLSSQGNSDPTKLSRDCFNAAFKAATRYSEGTVRNVGLYLEAISDVIDSEGLTAAPIQFQNPLDRKQPEPDPAMLPSEEALEALYRIADEPRLSKAEQIVIQVATILRLTGMRVNEVLSLPADCWIEDVRVEPQTGERILRYALRVWGSKGATTKPLYLPTIAVEPVKRAVDALKRLCAETRDAARQFELGECVVRGHPNLKTELKPTLKQFSSIPGSATSGVTDGHPSALSLETSDHQERERWANIPRGRDGLRSLHADDLDKFIVVKRDGQVRQWLSECLVVTFAFELSRAAVAKTHGLRRVQRGAIPRMPQRLSYEFLQRALSGTREKGGWIFSRRGLRAADGSPIRIRTHQFRHRVNTEAATGGPSGGLNGDEQARFFGRKSAAQNAVYDHQAPERHLFTAKGIRQLIEQGLVAGKLVDAYNSIKDPELQDALLVAHARQGRVIVVDGLDVGVSDSRVALATALGICVHDFSASPCPYHLVCLSGCGKFLRRIGNQSERDAIKVLRDFHQRELEKALRYGASSNYVDHFRKIVAGCDAALAVDTDVTPASGETVAVYPNGPCLGAPHGATVHVQLSRRSGAH
jgi:integrase